MRNDKSKPWYWRSGLAGIAVFLFLLIWLPREYFSLPYLLGGAFVFYFLGDAVAELVKLIRARL